jgi:hypothetical protein
MANILNDILEERKQKLDTTSFFAFVVDGEVAFVHGVDNRVEFMVAAMSSDPKVIKLTKEQAEQVNGGWSFDGQDFNSPANE